MPVSGGKPAPRRAPGTAERRGKDPFAGFSQEERAALEQLAEVERAMAALEGRNTAGAEYAVLFSRDAARRRAELEAVVAGAAARLARQRRRRLLRLAAAGLLLIGLAGAGAHLAPRFAAREVTRAATFAAAERAAEPFRAAGLTPWRGATAGPSLTVRVEPDRCYLAVASTMHEAAALRVERSAAAAEAIGSIAFCSCAAEDVFLSTRSENPAAVVVFSAPATRVGGSDLLSLLTPRASAVMPEPKDRACAERWVDGWLEHRRGETEKAPTTSPDATLEALGFQGLTQLAPHVPFATLPDATDACWLARASSPEAPLSLRLLGGARPLTGRGAVAFCARKLEAASLWREGEATVWLGVAPAPRVGGMLGLREAAERGGLAPATWIAEADLPIDVEWTLLGSGLAPAREPLDLEAATLAAFAAPTRLPLSLERAEGGAVACHPSPATGERHLLCLRARPGEWTLAGAAASTAKARRPTWLRLDPAAPVSSLELAHTLLRFARRMSLDRFELTTLEGVTPTPDGAVVTGRSREKEIVGVLLTSPPLRVHTLSDGPAWSVTGEPRVVPLAPGAKVRLTATPPLRGAGEAIDVVIWRR